MERVLPANETISKLCQLVADACHRTEAVKTELEKAKKDIKNAETDIQDVKGATQRIDVKIDQGAEKQKKINEDIEKARQKDYVETRDLFRMAGKKANRLERNLSKTKELARISAHEAKHADIKQRNAVKITMHEMMKTMNPTAAMPPLVLEEIPPMKPMDSDSESSEDSDEEDKNDDPDYAKGKRVTRATAAKAPRKPAAKKGKKGM